MNYQKPWTYEQIRQNYGELIANKLNKDPVHKWRMTTGIELIHKQPTLDEQERIWKNWQLMTDEQKQISDKKCLELTGMTNEQFNEFIWNNYWKNYDKQEKNKFDILYEEIMSEYVNDLKREKRPSYEIYIPLINNRNKYYFLNFYNNIITQDYHIFPVPKNLLDNLEEFISNNTDISKKENKVIEKQYSFNEILELIKDWDKYKEFQENIINFKCNITCCIFNSIENIKEIFKKYKNDQKNILKVYKSIAYVYDYYQNDNDFNICICINANRKIHKIRKIVQHELIHWMQVSLNSHTKKTYGLFTNKQFNLTKQQLDFITNALNKDEQDFKQDFEYVLNGIEFEAWIANTCEEFEDSKLTIQQYRNIIENQIIFRTVVNNVDLDKQEMFIFGEICYLSSLNDKNDDRYWYLIEALKQN